MGVCRFNVMLNADNWRWLQQHAKGDDRSGSYILNKLLLEYKNSFNKKSAGEVVKFNFKKQLLSLGVDESILNDWMLVRKNKKAANTETAFKRLMVEVQQSGLTINEAVSVAAGENWSGFKAQWYLNLKKGGAADSKYSAITNKNIGTIGDWLND